MHKVGEKFLIVLVVLTILVWAAVFFLEPEPADRDNLKSNTEKQVEQKNPNMEKRVVTPTAAAASTPAGVLELEKTSTPMPTEVPEPTNTPTPTVSPTPTMSPAPTPVVVDITISAAGDVTLGVNQKQGYSGSFDEYYDLYGEDYFLEYVKEIFEADDFTIVNLEGVLTNSDNIRTTKEWNMKGRPEYARILQKASVEAVSLGNNHIMDYQWEGVNDTFRNVTEHGMEYAISSPWGDKFGMYETTEGIKIGFVSVNEYYDGRTVYSWLEKGYASLREQGADLVFACMHWGGDKVYEPEPEQLELGHWCAELGFDLVLGCHPHVIQGIEYYNGTYIVHSMGNFCYGGSLNPSDKDSMIFQQTFTFVDGVLQEETSIRAIPCRLSSITRRNDFRPTPLVGEEAVSWADKLNALSAGFGLVFDAEGYLAEQVEGIAQEAVTETVQ